MYEQEIQLFITVLAALSLAYNVGVFIYALRSKPLKTHLAQDRSFTKGAMRAMLWVVVANMIYLANMTFAALLRNSYTLPVLIEEADAWVVWFVVEQHAATYAVSMLPATLLLWLVWGLGETDRLINVQSRAKQEVRRSMRASHRSSRDA